MTDAGEPTPDTSPPDAGGVDSGSDSGAAGCTSSFQGFGAVMANEDRTSAVAIFWSPGRDCPSEVSGACEYVRCGDATPPRLEAGRVELFGDLGEAPFEFDERQRIYLPEFARDPEWIPGGRVGFRGLGGEYPAFEHSITLPEPIELTETPPESITDTITVSWVPSDGTAVSIYLIDTSPDVSARVSCTFPRASGTGSVPAELIARLGPVRANVVVGTAHEGRHCERDHVFDIAAEHRAFDRFLPVDVR